MHAPAHFESVRARLKRQRCRRQQRTNLHMHDLSLLLRIA